MAKGDTRSFDYSWHVVISAVAHVEESLFNHQNNSHHVFGVKAHADCCLLGGVVNIELPFRASEIFRAAFNSRPNLSYSLNSSEGVIGDHLGDVYIS